MHSLHVTNLTRGFRDGGVYNLSFAVSRGERFAVFGDAGAGKSLLLALLAGRVQADEGEVRLLGLPPGEVSTRIGAALQPGAKKPSSTARQQLLSALAAAHIPSAQRPARLAEALDAAGLYERADRPLRELNHSACVSLRIAIAVVHRPEVVMLDDLLHLLPPAMRSRWWDHLEERRRLDGVTLVYATSDSGEAEAADRVLVLDRGRAMAYETPDSLLQRCGGEEIVVEAADVESVERTLRGIPHVEAVSSPDGIRFYAQDGAAVAAHLFRHPVGGMRSIFVRRPTLWDLLRPSRR